MAVQKQSNEVAAFMELAVERSLLHRRDLEGGTRSEGPGSPYLRVCQPKNRRRACPWRPTPYMWVSVPEYSVASKGLG